MRLVFVRPLLMQLKRVEKLIEETHGVVGSVIELQVLDRSRQAFRDRAFRIVANDCVVNLKDPMERRACLDVYASAVDTETGEMIYLSLEKLWKQGRGAK